MTICSACVNIPLLVKATNTLAYFGGASATKKKSKFDDVISRRPVRQKSSRFVLNLRVTFLSSVPIGLYRSLDGFTNLKYNLLCFLITILLQREECTSI
jgi:hypothetical protein